MTTKDKAFKLYYLFSNTANSYVEGKRCALRAVENEYKSLREQLFNLRACKVIEDFAVYNHRLNELIEQEEELKQEINKL